jgi:branched-chain amino acid transport system ATP-binding protein
VTTPALEVAGLNVSYGSFKALTDVALRLDPGSVHAVIGPNGAGKSTLAGSICGDIVPVSGRVLIGGFEVTRMPSWKRARRGLGRSYQVARVFDSLTVRENLDVASGRLHADRIAMALNATGLGAVANQKSQSLSAGDRKRLEIAVLIAQDAKVMILDEPTAGMSAAETSLMADLITVLARQGVGILIVEHDLDLVFSLADAVTVLGLGKVIFFGPPQDALRSEIVRDVYLHDRSEYQPVPPGTATPSADTQHRDG